MLINEKAVRQTALNMMEILRPYHKYTRVSKRFIRQIEIEVANLIRKNLNLSPRTGRTIDVYFEREETEDDA